MDQSHVSGWVAQFLPGQEQISVHREKLLALVGSRLTNAWIVWNLDDDTWFADLPVVLQFDNDVQLELCWEKFDDLAVSWNTVDVSIAPTAWVTWPLEWRSRAHESLANAVGSVVTDVSVLEYFLGTPSGVWARLPRRKAKPGSGEANGLWFDTDRGGLHVFNALDENGLSNDRPSDGRDHRVTNLRDLK